MAKKATRKTKKDEAAQFNMTTEATIAMPGMADQLAAMNSGANPDEIIEGGDDMTVEEEIAALMSGITPAIPEEALEKAVSAAEREATTQALYAEQGGAEPAVAPNDAPSTEAAPEKKGKKAKAPKAPKEPKPPRMTYVTNKKSEVLLHTLGENAKDFLVLEVADADLDTDALKTKQEVLLSLIDKKEDGGAAKKVGEKAVMLFKWLKAGGELNEVMKRAFTVLAKQGELTSGDKGNLQADLLAKPYSLGTARSQANQMFMLFPLLKITVKEKGRMIPNPDSVILAKAKAQLGL